MNLYVDLQGVPPQCPSTDCESQDVQVIETRPDGLPRYECRECATVWSDWRPPAEA